MKDRKARLRTVGMAVSLLSVLISGPGFAASFDMSKLPQSCQETIAEIQGEKAHFGALGKTMTRARKASDTAAFCAAAREIVTLIKAQNSRLDICIGELGSATDVPQGMSGQLLAVKAVYKNMIEATKSNKYDRFHCGLASD